MQFDPFVDVEIVSPLRDVHNFLYSKSLALTDPGMDHTVVRRENYIRYHLSPSQPMRTREEQSTGSNAMMESVKRQLLGSQIALIGRIV